MDGAGGSDYWLCGDEDRGANELLALMLGGRAGGSWAAALLGEHGSVSAMLEAGPQALAVVPGVGVRRAVQLHAALQLGCRSVRAPVAAKAVRSPADAAAQLAPALRGLRVEELHGLFLDRRRRPLARRRLTRGSDHCTVVDPRQVFRVALQVGAAAVVLAHNHPSGDPEPSALDDDVTRRVVAAGRVVGVVLLDHLVIAGERFTSLAERGVIGAEGLTAQS